MAQSVLPQLQAEMMLRFVSNGIHVLLDTMDLSLVSHLNIGIRHYSGLIIN